MSRRSKSFRIFDFSGGLNTKSSATNVDLKEASDLQNINILPGGGFTARNGNSVYNSSALASGAALTGIPYFRLSSGSDFLCAVAGTKFHSDSNLSGTFSDVTGAITISSGASNFWTFSTMNDLLIGVGGAPDAPFKYSGTGNAAALGGTPPSGNFGLQAKNYFFIGNTAANPSRIQWSILGNPEDWSGTGSGSQDVSKNDGDTLVGAAVINLDHMLLFKQNSIHDMIITNNPFPVFPKFIGTGAVSKRGIVVVDGVAYFITAQPRMKATDGNQIFTFPNTIDDVWDGLNVSRLKYIQGVYYKKYNQIWWFCSNTTSTTHNVCLIWDLNYKCWLRHTTGYKMNCAAIARDYIPYGGAYDGKAYQLDKTATYADASETSPGPINAYWRTGWIDLENMIQAKYMPYFEVSFLGQTTGTFDISYGFDFSQDRGTTSISMVAPGGKWNVGKWNVMMWGGQSNLNKFVFPKGLGKYIQFLIRHNSSTEGFTFNEMEIPIKVGAPSAIS